MRVMSWNIKTGVGNDPHHAGVFAPFDLDRVARVISSLRPDIVALQEVDRWRRRTECVDQPSVLADMTGMDVVYGPNLVDEEGEYGIAILSRHPFVAVDHIRFPEVTGWEPRGLLDVVVRAGGRELRVMNTHLQVGGRGNDQEARSQREDSAQAIALRARQSEMPVVVMGDFNADPAPGELSPLATFTDAWQEKGEGPGETIPATPFGDARARIDAILVGSGLFVRECAVIRTPETMLASDHYPVVADLAFAPQ